MHLCNSLLQAAGSGGLQSTGVDHCTYRSDERMYSVSVFVVGMW